MIIILMSNIEPSMFVVFTKCCEHTNTLKYGMHGNSQTHSDTDTHTHTDTHNIGIL